MNGQDLPTPPRRRWTSSCARSRTSLSQAFLSLASTGEVVVALELDAGRGRDDDAAATEILVLDRSGAVASSFALAGGIVAPVIADAGSFAIARRVPTSRQRPVNLDTPVVSRTSMRRGACGAPFVAQSADARSSWALDCRGCDK